MGSIDARFHQLRRAHRKALIPFIMGGHPNLAVTAPLLLALQDAGADLIEVGIPFSDPLADGPVIQAASARALAGGATPDRVLSEIASVRHRLHVPVVCLTYWNPVIQFGGNGRQVAPSKSSSAGRARPSPRGIARPAPAWPAFARRHSSLEPRQGSPHAFLRAAAASGVSGVIIPDLPVEEGAVLRDAATSVPGFATIFLAAPTSPPQRLRLIAHASRGFIYYVSVTGTTGMRRELPPQLVHGVRQLKLLTTKPICVGFGIARADQAAAVARVADGVIVGSALVHVIGQARGRAAILAAAARFLAHLRKAV